MTFELVVIGASLGGLHAVATLLGGLPGNFGLPVAIVQHRHRESEGALATVLQRASKLPVCDVEDKQAIRSGIVCLAPADYHLLVERDVFALSTEAPVLYSRPSINVLFESAADAYGPQVIGIILTGASADGADGLAAIKAAGGLAVVQDPATAECRVMPEAALESVVADHVLPVPAIATLLTQLGAGELKVAP
ncbi:MAG: chemotaxis protein CheB [Chloroflexi bacterium]|nr:MAG: chemotaxis protein CheB [Chloroflexota bacterium]